MNKPAASTASPLDKLPAWYPAWARELAELYFSGTTCLFILHGNVHDLIHCPDGDEDAYCSLAEFLTTQVFGTWDLVLGYDLSQGLRPQAGRECRAAASACSSTLTRAGASRPAGRAIPSRSCCLLDAFIERNLVDEPASRKSVAVLFDYAQYLIPAGDLDALARGQAARLVRFLRWAQNPLIKQVNMAFCLVADRLAEVNERLVQSPHVATIEVPLPDREERCRFSQWATRGQDFAKLADFSPEQLADMSNGLSLANLNVVLSQAMRSRPPRRRRVVPPVEEVGDRAAVPGAGRVHRARPHARHGRRPDRGQEAAPGRRPVDQPRPARRRADGLPDLRRRGHGQDVLAECYAGSIGIPCVVLKNFRSKYVGETEGNLQQVLAVLRSLGPVVVIVDEADAALGNRQAEGDSGTSARVFSMIAAQMGNTRYRGQIVWMLLTSRPDLLPIDLKRQGRAEVHIPLFYPYEDAEIRAMFEVMARKNKVKLAADALPAVSADGRLSGADIESIVLAAKRAALSAGRTEPDAPPTWKRRWRSSFPRRRVWRRRCRRRPPCWNARN